MKNLIIYNNKFNKISIRDNNINNNKMILMYKYNNN